MRHHSCPCLCAVCAGSVVVVVVELIFRRVEGRVGVGPGSKLELS